MLLTIVAFVFVLSILVFIHEFGHFIMAKIVGVRVERFSLGYPPRIIGKQIGDTDYCISAIPIGGFVKLSGMIDESMEKDAIKGEPWEFMSKPAWQRFLIIFNGPLMNLLLTVAIFAILNYISGVNEPASPTIGPEITVSYLLEHGLQNGDIILEVNNSRVNSWSEVEKIARKNEQLSVQLHRGSEIVTTTLPGTFINHITQTQPPVIGEVIPESPAATIGLQSGDIIVNVDGQDINSWFDLTQIIHAKPQEDIMVTWTRDGTTMSKSVTPVTESDTKGRIGISPMLYTRDIGLVTAVSSAFDYSIRVTVMIFESLKRIITGQDSFKNAFGGPILIAKMAGESARSGMSTLFIFMAFLSLNLGLINLLPIPVLDGGHIIYLIIEAIIRRPISPKIKLIVQQIGMALLLALMVFVIINDIRRFL